MKKNIIFALCLSFLNFINLFSQSTNLVPNYSFEYGSHGPCWYYPSNVNCAAMDGIYNWEIAYNKVNLAGNCMTYPFDLEPDCQQLTSWVEYNNYVTAILANPALQIISLPTTNAYTSRCLHLDGPKDKVRVGLISPVTAWKTYTLRMKILCYSSPALVDLFLSNWGAHWNSNQAENSKTYIGSFSPSLADCAWTQYVTTFSTSEDLENLTIVSKYGEILIDDVEIYEQNSCPNVRLQQNKNYYISEPVYEGYDIIAGSNVGDVNGVGPVVVRATTGNIKYKATHRVSLEPGFKAESGSYFHAYLAPCGEECFPPVAITGTVNDGDDLCGMPTPGTTYQLGAPPVDNMTYQWTATPSSDLSYLSGTSISNPVFTPPTAGYGTISYTLTVTNDCGETDSEILAIDYNTNSQPVFGGISSTSSNQFDGLPYFNIVYTQYVSDIFVEVYNPNYTGIKRTFLLKAGVDFPPATTSQNLITIFHYPYVCEVYTGNEDAYPIKLYYKSYCEANWNLCSNSCLVHFNVQMHVEIQMEEKVTSN